MRASRRLDEVKASRDSTVKKSSVLSSPPPQRMMACLAAMIQGEGGSKQNLFPGCWAHVSADTWANAQTNASPLLAG